MEKIYKKIYKSMEEAKSKNLKIILKPNLLGVLIIIINKKNNFSFPNDEAKNIYVYKKQASIDFLIEKVIYIKGNREKIKLRNFLFISNKKLWKQ